MKVAYAVAICSLPLVSATSLGSASLAFAQEGRWDTPKIDSLIQSTTNLIRDAMKNETTTAIQRFAEATIEKIEDDVIPKLHEEHKTDREYLDKEFAKFGEKNDTIQGEVVSITQKELECERSHTQHIECRTTESKWRSNHTQCTLHLEKVKELKGEACDLFLGDDQDEFTELWCQDPPITDDYLKTSLEPKVLKKTFFEESKTRMQAYMKQTIECSTEWEEYIKWNHTCTTIVTEVYEWKTECDGYQHTFEKCTCQLANNKNHLVSTYSQLWNMLTGTYEAAVELKRKASVNRAAEFTGLQVVKCLLEQVRALGLQNGPCDESHVAQVEADIKACKDATHDTSSFAFHAELAPHLNISEIFEQKPYPCNPEFINLHYNNMPENASHAACHCEACEVALRHWSCEQ